MSNDKVIFLQWLRGFNPKVDEYFGADKLDQWANDQIASKEYDQLFSWHKNVRDDLIHGFLISHGIGQKEPSFTNDPNPYDIILAFFGNQLEKQNEELANTTDPTARNVIQQEIARTTKAINYYTTKQKGN